MCFMLNQKVKTKSRKYLIFTETILVILGVFASCISININNCWAEINVYSNEFFSGDGTKEKPYLIESYDDLILLQKLVNEGNSFENCFFKQVVDIDMFQLPYWVPIGKVGSGKYFYGNYDGDGHKILNFQSFKENYGGLFGSLGGEISNLGIQGELNGNYSGAFASFSDSTNARIINCYSIISSPCQYTGGIAYTFSGEIIHCASCIDNANETNFGICCEGIGNISYSYTTATSLVNLDNFVGEIFHSESGCKIDEIVEKLNDSFVELFDKTEILKYYTWKNASGINYDKKITWTNGHLDWFYYYFIKNNFFIQMCLFLSLGLGIFLIINVLRMIPHTWLKWKNNLKEKKIRIITFINDKKLFFVILMLINYVGYWLSIYMSNGKRLTFYFVHDVTNSFMDFFNPIIKLPELTYTDPYYSNYPALPNMIFAMYRKIIPEEYLLSGETLKTCIWANILFIITMFIAFLFIYQIMCKMMPDDWKSKLVIMSLLFSGPFLFLYERGNNLIFVIGLVLFFIHNYDNDNLLLHELALVSLALAVALKVYPILFCILLLQKERLKGIIRFVNYTFLAIIIPFFYYDGIVSFIQFLTNLVNRNQNPRTYGLGYNFSFDTIQRLVYQMKTGEYLLTTNKFLYLIPIVLCLTLFFLSKNKKWKQTLAICMLIIWLPSESYTYVLCFLVIPLILFLQEERKAWDNIYILCFVGIFSLYSMKRLEKLNILDVTYPISIGMIIIHVSLYLIVVLGILEETILIKEKLKT